jgi:hypothetical protein
LSTVNRRTALSAFGLAVLGAPLLARSAWADDPLTTTPIPGTPARLSVSDSTGWLATLTTGAKTVIVRGPQRTFTDAKRPFTEAFTRTLTSGWGSSPGGGKWSTVNGTDADYRIENGVGVISVTGTGVSRHATLGDDQIADVDAVTTVGFDKVTTGATIAAALSFGYVDLHNHYRARLSVTTSGTVQLTLEKEVDSTVTTLGATTTVGTGYAAGDQWRVRVTKTGTALRAKAWRGTEPGSWTLTATDSTFTHGRVGYRVLASSGNTALPIKARFDDLTVSGTWIDPPTLTHDKWVRVLPSAFTGTWNASVEQQVRDLAASTAPDALEFTTRFQAFAPPGLDSQGRQVFGDAGYGPLDTDGTREEGADFYEYMGGPWDFPNGEHKDDSGPAWQGFLDCSGFVRMVYGLHMGLPMVFGHDYNGVNMPRTSANLADHGPGVVVSSSSSAPPSLANIQIGDTVYFDAEADDGDIDHVGIHVGVDQHGLQRFISSRKSGNGPTFADLGGDSVLTGTGLYAQTLRIIRRF